jgi:hypothetical protein
VDPVPDPLLFIALYISVLFIYNYLTMLIASDNLQGQMVERFANHCLEWSARRLFCPDVSDYADISLDA